MQDLQRIKTYATFSSLLKWPKCWVEPDNFENIFRIDKPYGRRIGVPLDKQ